MDYALETFADTFVTNLYVCEVFLVVLVKVQHLLVGNFCQWIDAEYINNVLLREDVELGMWFFFIAKSLNADWSSNQRETDYFLTAYSFSFFEHFVMMSVSSLVCIYSY